MVATFLTGTTKDMLRFSNEDLAGLVRWKNPVQMVISGSGDGIWYEIDQVFYSSLNRYALRIPRVLMSECHTYANRSRDVNRRTITPLTMTSTTCALDSKEHLFLYFGIYIMLHSEWHSLSSWAYSHVLLFPMFPAHSSV